MTATQAPTPGPLSVEITYEVYQDGDFCASSTRLQDAEHYAGLYGQDGPVKCHTVVSVRHDDFLLPGDARLAPTAPVEASGSEREDEDAIEVEDMEWPESPLANDLYQHIQSQFCLHPDEAAEETGEVLSILAKHGVDPTKLPLNLRPQPSGETREWITGDDLHEIMTTFEERADVSEIAAKINERISASPLALGGQQGVPADVARLVVAARMVAYHEDGDALAGLDKAVEAFADRVPWDDAPEDTTPARAEAQDEGAAGARFQDSCGAWLDVCFGPESRLNVEHRNARFLEEAVELVQASGMTEAAATDVVRYAFSRPQGEISQEVGGVMMTLAAHCLATGADMMAEGERELARVWTKVDQIRAKEAAKPSFAHPSPTPAADADRVRELENVLRNIALMDCYTREDEEPIHMLMMRLASDALKSTAAKEGGEA